MKTFFFTLATLAFSLFACSEICKKTQRVPVPGVSCQAPLDEDTLPMPGQAAILVTVQGDEIPTRDGAVTVDVGELVRVDFQDSHVDGLDVAILPPSLDFEVIDNGRRAYFSSRGPGEWLVIVAGASLGDATLSYFRIVATLQEPTPAVHPITTLVRTWMDSVEEYEGREIHGRAIASVFRRTAGQGDIDVEKMIEATALSNSAVLGDNLAKWVGLFDLLGAQLDAYVGDGTLTTRDDYRIVWEAVARGIEEGL